MATKRAKRGRPKLPELRAVRGVSDKPDTTVFTNSLIAAVANISDIEEAVRIAVEWAAHLFDASHAETLAECEDEIAFLEVERARLEADAAEIRREMDATPEYMTSASLYAEEGETPKSLPFSRWTLAHKIEAPVALTAACVVSYTSFEVTRANLLASGSAVFIDNPALAGLLGAMVPATALAIKTTYSIFWRARARARFRAAIYGGSVVAFAAWLWLFSHQFHGFETDIDIFGDEPSGDGALFVMVQLAAETLAGAALLLRATTISEYYAPNFRRANHEYDDLVQKLPAPINALKDVRRKLKDNIALRDGVAAARAKFLVEIEVAVRERSARFNA